MKTALRIILFLIVPFTINAQITGPAIRANFGVDGDLRCNYFNGLVQSGNDDWFLFPGSVGTGQFVIDTTGAAARVARYATDLNYRKIPFYANMRYPTFSVVNNRLLIDAVFIRDYHGDDSTIFASGSNKNGMSPATWTCPVAQSVPDKNEILDMAVHVRRAGPTRADSLWMFGGVSIENTTGNRYFDFEMYQTDIYYDRASRKFYNYGPDDGHTSWKFDSNGDITQPGDIIFSAEFGTSALTLLEARIWVKKSDWMSVVPLDFNWSGQFDGDGSGAVYGYASITPKLGGTFYTGLQSNSNTWAGPFNLVLGDNSVVTNYTARQFMEISVNLTKLGLDPVTLLGGSSCGMPFRRVLVKSRSSTSFTSELKDFIGPFDLFLAPRVDVATETPYICDTGSVAEIRITNPVSTSVYNWSTINGNIISGTTGPVIMVDTPGTYIVTQYLQEGCTAYATDTITILPFPDCGVLANNLYDFTASYAGGPIQLNWKVLNNQLVNYIDVQRSIDGINFTTIDRVGQQYEGEGTNVLYGYKDEEAGLMAGRSVYYRVILTSYGNTVKYSPVVRMDLKSITKNAVTILPNPVRDIMQIQVSATAESKVKVNIIDQTGKMIIENRSFIQPGTTVLTMDDLANQPRGVYLVLVTVGEELFKQKVLHIR